MARRSNKGRKAQNADSSSVLQSQENQKPKRQTQRPKQQQQKNQSRKGGRKNKNKAAPAPKTQTAKLDLPDRHTQVPEPGARMPWDLDPKYNSAVDAGRITSVNDNSILVRLLQVSELSGMIIDLISPSVRDITALAMSCKRVAACTRAKFDVWDFRGGVFPTEPYAKKQDEEGHIIQGGGFRSNTLIISPTSDEPRCPKKPYMTDFWHMMQLCRAIAQIPSTFRSIVLDQLPFFDVAMFELMINTMPRLTTVTITRCLLLDVTKLRPLLGVIKRHPRRLEDRPSRTMPNDPWAKMPKQKMSGLEAQAQVETSRNNAGREGTQRRKTQQKKTRQGTRAYIRLDFSPFFFSGPESGARLGTYGVTHNEPTFNTPKAVFALILQCRDLARTVGMDLLSDSSSFWAFVRRLPGPDVLWALKARETLMTREHELAVGKKSAEIIWDRFADDLTAALTGDNQTHPRMPATMARYRSYEMTGKYWRSSEECRMCGSTYPVSLFPLRRDTCWGCKMVRYVEMMEDSHLRLWQESALQQWRSGLNLPRTNLRKLLSYKKSTLDKALEDVRCADWVREYFLDFNPPPQSTAAYDWGTGTPPEPLYCPPPPRRGGPQRSHPCTIPLSASDSTDPNYGAEAQEHFESRWEWTELSDKIFTDIWFQEYRDKVAEDRLGNLPSNITDDQHPAFERELKRARKMPEYRKRVQEREWLKQNKEDKTSYATQLNLIEDCLWSMSTLTRKPFNLDKPIPDPGVDPVAYNRLLDEHSRMSGYGFRKEGFWQ
ncbi:uncharacterized protein B0H64DRAFT_414134 [Chaetomium fimeti]|uniref:Uncharacterized protein n=1 Tax=Chaetomium fimeti TaxID=1854472 RepID=A0AAE0HNS3_9PEZI|nr:hypothetical protein B0H64DRAFT_414134 [Chaetomium fimeti]